MPDESPFKTCSLCGRVWPTLPDLVRDLQLQVNGYQPSFSDANEGFVLLTHRPRECGTTLAIRVHLLRPLYHGEPYTESLKGTTVCRRHCLDQNDLETCDAPCALAWVRQVIQTLRRHEAPEEE